MNTVWQESPNQRLKTWRSFRKEIQDLEDKPCLEKVVEWWKYTPIGSRVIDPYESKEWPDPWNLIYIGNFDENAVALGIAYTIHLLDWPCEVLLVQNTKLSFVGLVVLVDDQYVLNYTYGSIDDSVVLRDCEILDRWYTNELTK